MGGCRGRDGVGVGISVASTGSYGRQEGCQLNMAHSVAGVSSNFGSLTLVCYRHI